MLLCGIYYKGVFINLYYAINMKEIPFEPEGFEHDPADKYLDENKVDPEVLQRLAEADAAVIASETGEVSLDATNVLAKLAEADATVTPVLNEPNPKDQIRALPDREVAVLRELFLHPSTDLNTQAILKQAASEYQRGALSHVPEDIAAFLKKLPIE